MKNVLFILSFAVACATGCHQKPVVGDNDAVKATYLHKYGLEVDDATDWKERGASGQVIQKLKNGACITTNWKNGKRHGLATTTFPNSETVFQRLEYENDICVKKTTNYLSGMPKKDELYEAQELSQISTWYEDGLPQSLERYQQLRLVSGSYFTPSQDLEAEIEQGQGERPVRDGYGQLKGKDLFTDGLLTMKVELHTTGIPKSYTPYSQGVRQGTRKTFSPTGEPETIEEWNNDRLNGTMVLFQNGEKIAEIPYINDQKNGVEKHLRVGTDEVVKTISWSNNMRHGPSIVSIDDTTITDWYFEGSKVSRAEFAERR